MVVIIINFIAIISILLVYKIISNIVYSGMFVDTFILKIFITIIAPVFIILMNCILRYFYNLGIFHLIYTFIPIIIPIVVLCREKIEEKIKKKYYLEFSEKFKLIVIEELNNNNLNITEKDIALSIKRNSKKEIIVVLYITLIDKKFDYFTLQSNIEKKLKSSFESIKVEVLFQYTVGV